MKIVIDIPENTYKRIQALAINNYFEHDICGNSMQRIANGTPLPKGHGRIIDESKITSIYYHEEEARQEAIRVNYLVIDGTDAPTIIEADKESEGEE